MMGDGGRDSEVVKYILLKVVSTCAPAVLSSEEEEVQVEILVHRLKQNLFSF